MPSNEAGRMARSNGHRVRWRNSDCKTPCGAEGDPEKVPDTFFPSTYAARSARISSPIACGKGCFGQLSFSGLGHAPALALTGATPGLPAARPACGSRNFLSCQVVFPQQGDVRHQRLSSARSWERLTCLRPTFYRNNSYCTVPAVILTRSPYEVFPRCA
jgi:hypothetical protein